MSGFGSNRGNAASPLWGGSSALSKVCLWVESGHGSLISPLLGKRRLREIEPSGIAASMTLPDDLRETIVATEAALSDARNPWWIISSAAAAIHGAHPITVADVDVILSVQDATRIFRRFAIKELASSDHPRFRSKSFGQWTRNPLMAEFMADFTLREADGVWRPMKPVTRQEIRLGATSVFVPEIRELRMMFERFGRPKDYERIALLEKLGC